MQLAASLNPNLERNQSGPEGLVLATHFSGRGVLFISKFNDRVDEMLIRLQMI